MTHRRIFIIQFTSFSIFSVRPKRLKLFVLGRNEGIQPLLAIAPMCLFSNDGIVVESVASRISSFSRAEKIFKCHKIIMKQFARFYRLNGREGLLVICVWDLFMFMTKNFYDNENSPKNLFSMGYSSFNASTRSS